jgi:transposase
VTTLLPVVDRLRTRFGVGRIYIVADRGMISAQTIAALEHRKLEYVLGVRERSSAECAAPSLMQRHRHSRPCVLLFSRAPARQGTRRSAPPARCCRRMG